MVSWRLVSYLDSITLKYTYLNNFNILNKKATSKSTKTNNNTKLASFVTLVQFTNMLKADSPLR